MKRLLLLFSFFSGLVFGQAPDCIVRFGPWTDLTASTSFDNRTQGCFYWVLNYQSTGFTALSLAFESATGVVTPGSFGNFTGTVVSGINPNTSTSGATSTFSGFVSWYRVNLASKTGSGTISGILQGYKSGVPLGGSTPPGTACPGTIATPCVVVGPTAAGSAPTTSPVLVAGTDGTNLRTLATDASGFQKIIGTVATGTAFSNFPVIIGGVNGGNARQMVTDGNGNISASASFTGVDAQSNSNLSVPIAGGGSTFLPIHGLYAYNGTTWDRVRTASLTNFPVATTLTARNFIGVPLVEKGSRWSVISNPAAGSQATASIAAEASVRHVVDCITFSAIASGATVATNLTVNVRDGATGAGTIIWTNQVGAPILAAGGYMAVPHSFCGLNLVGTTNTAMTLEFSAALANLVESVSISGYNVN